MRQDWSWHRAAGKYLALYESARKARLDAIERAREASA